MSVNTYFIKMNYFMRCLDSNAQIVRENLLRNAAALWAWSERPARCRRYEFQIYLDRFIYSNMLAP